MSIGGAPSVSLDNAITAASRSPHNLPVIVAGGNDADDACNHSPSDCADAFVVGAVQPHPGDNSMKDETSYSNFGNCISIYAPGGDAGTLSPQRQIESAWYSGDSDYKMESGTSMATPHVAGLCAGLLAHNQSLTPPQLFNAILARAQGNSVFSLQGTARPQPFAQGIGTGTLNFLQTVLDFLLHGVGLVLSILGAVVLVSVAIALCSCCFCANKRTGGGGGGSSSRSRGPPPSNPYVNSSSGYATASQLY